MIKRFLNMRRVLPKATPASPVPERGPTTRAGLTLKAGRIASHSAAVDALGRDPSAREVRGHLTHAPRGALANLRRIPVTRGKPGARALLEPAAGAAWDDDSTAEPTSARSVRRDVDPPPDPQPSASRPPPQPTDFQPRDGHRLDDIVSRYERPVAPLRDAFAQTPSTGSLATAARRALPSFAFNLPAHPLAPDRWRADAETPPVGPPVEVA